MSPTRIRNAVILGLTLTGVILLIWGMGEDPMARRILSAGGCWVVAWVYAQLNPPPGGPHGETR